MPSFDKATVEKIIVEIFNEINKKNEEKESLGILDGECGYILFSWYLAKYFPQIVTPSYIEEKLNIMQDKLQSKKLEPGICRGLSGIGWLFELILQEQEDCYNPEFNRVVDLHLENLTNDYKWRGEIEYVMGLSGLSVYAGRRLLKNEGHRLLSNIVNYYYHSFISIKKDQISWSTPVGSVYRFNNLTNGNEYNLGIAHGVPGIILSLIPALNMSALKDKSTEMIYKACNWLIDQQECQGGKSSNFYGYLAGDNGNSRLGWCYGDLGIALTLARAGNALNNVYIKEQALRIAISAAQRDVYSAQVVDAGICHGSSGLAIMFYFINDILPHPKLQEAIHYWTGQIILSYKVQGLKGLDFYVSYDNQFESNRSILNGYSGIGLVLLAMLDIEPNWGDLLLLRNAD